jgi:hypothetical protein
MENDIQSGEPTEQSAMTPLSKSTMEAFECSVDLIVLIQRQRLFILDFFQNRAKATTLPIPF